MKKRPDFCTDLNGYVFTTGKAEVQTSLIVDTMDGIIDTSSGHCVYGGHVDGKNDMYTNDGNYIGHLE